MRFSRAIQVLSAAVFASNALLVGPQAAATDVEQRPVAAVSLVNLLADPESYKQELVQTAGFLVHGIGLKLFLTSAHAGVFDSSSAISVYPQNERILECAGRFVIVVGEFDWNPHTKRFEIVGPIEIRYVPPSGLEQSICWSLAK